MTYVTIEQCSKSFGKQAVLHHLDLSFEQGEFVTLLGPSGCGKSTLLRIIAGLTTQDSGKLYIDGKEVTHTAPRDRQVGMVFQSYALFPNLTVTDNIAFGLKMNRLESKQMEREVAAMIELVGLQGKEKAFPRELSGGQQQRVALARSLVTKPKLLLLDEPLSALDAQIRKHLRKQLRDIQRRLNMTTVLVTHDQEEAMSISDRIYLMNGGRIEQAGTPHDIYTKPRSPFVAKFIGNYNVVSRDELSRMMPTLANVDKLMESTASLYAIRPETLSEQPFEQGIPLTGKVDHLSMLGNITRCEFITEGCRLYADHLHRTFEHTIIGETKTWYIDPKDVIPLYDDAA
ncbi:ABC transporter ATP-binding protein [Paenibacillus taiwanensis]|uniref:ABC transporter ATP-binding protein n=1 Tax=Paenibacillus taiwanensis TaxID=401638 RepID=UPI00041D6088|nr:ABC transporter ATP-binding protein [Paenibacillus taiwanensis]